MIVSGIKAMQGASSDVNFKLTQMEEEINRLTMQTQSGQVGEKKCRSCGGRHEFGPQCPA